MSEKYKLTYFDLRGRAEPIRLILALAGVDFEDRRIKREEWNALKPTTPWGQLPVLEIGNLKMSQTVTIGRFLGRKFNLCGSNELEHAKCDEIVDAVSDLVKEWFKYYFEEDERKRAENKIALIEKAFPLYLGKLNKTQDKNGGHFLVCGSVTWADVWTTNILERMEATVGKDVLNPYPNLKKLKHTVFSIPNIKAYVDKRPPT